MSPGWVFGAIALAFFPSSLQGGSSDAVQLRKKAFALYESGRVGESLPLFEKCLRLNPDDVPVLETLGYVRYRAEDFAQSGKIFERLLNTGESRSYALFMLGNIAFRKFKLGEALRFYEEVKSRDPGYPSLEENIALLRERIGRVEELKKLRKRCDVFYFGSLVLGGLFLAAATAVEAGGRRRGFPKS